MTHCFPTSQPESPPVSPAKIINTVAQTRTYDLSMPAPSIFIKPKDFFFCLLNTSPSPSFLSPYCCQHTQPSPFCLESCSSPFHAPPHSSQRPSSNTRLSFQWVTTVPGTKSRLKHNVHNVPSPVCLALTDRSVPLTAPYSPMPPTFLPYSGSRCPEHLSSEGLDQSLCRGLFSSARLGKGLRFLLWGLTLPSQGLRRIL